MIKRAIEVLEPGNKINKISISTITLPYDRRHCRRKKMTDDEGKSFLLDLKNATLLKDGDRLLLESEECILICAATEEVADIKCISASEASRVAWHIRTTCLIMAYHVPMQILKNSELRILRDDVLIDMVRGLGASVAFKNKKFQPEGGAYIKVTDHAH